MIGRVVNPGQLSRIQRDSSLSTSMSSGVNNEIATGTVAVVGRPVGETRSPTTTGNSMNRTVTTTGNQSPSRRE